MSADDSSVPVYFAWETPDVLDIYEGVMAGSGDDAATAVEGNYFTADVLQMRPLGEKCSLKIERIFKSRLVLLSNVLYSGTLL